MSTTFLPFAKPNLSDAAIAEVVACLQSGWITTGPRVQRFEEMLRQYFPAPHALTLISATAGLHLALLALDLQPGDEVITTPLTFVATLNTIVQSGGTPVLVDIDPATLLMDLNQLETKITPRTRAIVPVHFAGLPMDLDALYAISNRHQLRVIEDAAHAIGARYRDQLLGSFGDTQVFSFHPNKNMTTGEGGCVTTRDENMAQKISQMRFHGIDRNAFNRFSKSGSQHYDVVAPGFKYNMMDIQAALGLHQLPELADFIAARTRIVTRYQQEFHDWPELTLPSTPAYSHQHAWHLFTPRINPEAAGMDRDAFIQAMKDHDIGTGLHFVSAHLYTYYREKFGFKSGDYPHAESAGSRIVSLPLFPHMTEAEQDRVIETMQILFKRKKK